jgi:hypothetical protein
MQGINPVNTVAHREKFRKIRKINAMSVEEQSKLLKLAKQHLFCLIVRIIKLRARQIKIFIIIVILFKGECLIDV